MCRLSNFIHAGALILSLTSCATLSNRQKTLITMGVAGTAAGILGAQIAPAGESPLAHGALWGGGATALAAALSLYIFDEDARRREADAKAIRLEKELAAFREGQEPELVSSNLIGLTKPLPEKFKNLVTPGQWSLYKVDRWASSSDSELVHQDYIFRFSQPQLNPVGALNPKTKTESE